MVAYGLNPLLVICFVVYIVGGILVVNSSASIILLYLYLLKKKNTKKTLLNWYCIGNRVVICHMVTIAATCIEAKPLIGGVL
jgi:hypothetical protein